MNLNDRIIYIIITWKLLSRYKQGKSISNETQISTDSKRMKSYSKSGYCDCHDCILVYWVPSDSFLCNQCPLASNRCTFLAQGCKNWRSNPLLLVQGLSSTNLGKFSLYNDRISKRNELQLCYTVPRLATCYTWLPRLPSTCFSPKGRGVSYQEWRLKCIQITDIFESNIVLAWPVSHMRTVYLNSCTPSFCTE